MQPIGRITGNPETILLGLKSGFYGTFATSLGQHDLVASTTSSKATKRAIRFLHLSRANWTTQREVLLPPKP
jgi:hypothetical protein